MGAGYSGYSAYSIYSIYSIYSVYSVYKVYNGPALSRHLPQNQITLFAKERKEGAIFLLPRHR